MKLFNMFTKHGYQKELNDIFYKYFKITSSVEINDIELFYLSDLENRIRFQYETGIYKDISKALIIEDLNGKIEKIGYELSKESSFKLPNITNILFPAILTALGILPVIMTLQYYSTSDVISIALQKEGAIQSTELLKSISNICTSIDDFCSNYSTILLGTLAGIGIINVILFMIEYTVINSTNYTKQKEYDFYKLCLMVMKTR